MSKEGLNEALVEPVEATLIEAEWISNKGMSVIGDIEFVEEELFKRLKAKGLMIEAGTKIKGSKAVVNKEK